MFLPSETSNVLWKSLLTVSLVKDTHLSKPFLLPFSTSHVYNCGRLAPFLFHPDVFVLGRRVVDRPTQPIWILFQQTNTKDIAG